MKVVALSHEIGSFGKAVALDLAQNTDLTLIPFSRVYRLALERNERFRWRKEEAAEGRGDLDIWEGLFFSEPCFTSLFESLILEMAAQGDVILMGVGAQAVLTPCDGLLKVHLRAPLETRITRFMDLNSLTVGEAGRTVHWWDQRLRALFDLNPAFENAVGESCDLVINTERVSISAASRLLRTAVGDLPGVPDPARWRTRLSRLALAKRVENAVREGDSALGTAPLEVLPAEEPSEALLLTGFVHTEAGAAAALVRAQAASEGHAVLSHLKLLRLHQDILPPGYLRPFEESF
jgi:hypothetical protein